MGNVYHKGDSEVKKNILLQNASVILDQFEKNMNFIFENNK